MTSIDDRARFRRAIVRAAPAAIAKLDRLARRGNPRALAILIAVAYQPTTAAARGECPF